MLLKVRNRELILDQEKTYLTDSVDSGDTTLTVKAVDSNSMSDNDWIIVGEIGSENAEVLQINGAVSDGTSLTVDNAGSGGTRYAHSNGEPVYKILYNQVEFSHNSSDTSVGVTVLATNEIQPDDEFTRYEDTSNTTGYGFVRFKNTTDSTYSSYSDGVPYTGYSKKSLGRMIKAVRRLLGNPCDKKISDSDIREEINEKQRDVGHERLWPFYETVRSVSSVQYQRKYDLDNDIQCGKIWAINFDSQPLAKVNRSRFDMFNWDNNKTGDPTHFSIWNNKIVMYPLPDSSADTDELDGDITASVTTITLADVSDFRAPGRVLIGSEVISFEFIDSENNQLKGCERGKEGTTAAAHSDGDTVTERDIIYIGQEEPDELLDIQDETKIPDPMVLIYGAAMELAQGPMEDINLHDRIIPKYSKSIERLRDKFGNKSNYTFFSIKDKDDYVNEYGRYVNPNDYPEDLSKE